MKTKSSLNKTEWLERFTKKEDKKKAYQDPNITFKPTLNKKTEKLLSKNGAKYNAFD